MMDYKITWRSVETAPDKPGCYEQTFKDCKSASTAISTWEREWHTQEEDCEQFRIEVSWFAQPQWNILRTFSPVSWLTKRFSIDVSRFNSPYKSEEG